MNFDQLCIHFCKCISETWDYKEAVACNSPWKLKLEEGEITGVQNKFILGVIENTDIVEIKPRTIIVKCFSRHIYGKKKYYIRLIGADWVYLNFHDTSYRYRFKDKESRDIFWTELEYIVLYR